MSAYFPDNLFSCITLNLHWLQKDKLYSIVPHAGLKQQQVNPTRAKAYGGYSSFPQIILFKNYTLNISNGGRKLDAHFLTPGNRPYKGLATGHGLEL